jgi:1-deoxy-D-xylulose-5-phosphate synthase
MKPLDHGLIAQLARHHEVFITIEDGAAGGFGAAVAHALSWSGAFDHGLKFRPMTFPDRLIDHNAPAAQLVDAGLTARHIVQHALEALGSNANHGLVAIPAQ